MANLKLVLGSAALLLAAQACSTPETATGLHPEGPPEIQDVFMFEEAPDTTGALRRQQILAFGHHDDVPMERTHATEKAAAVSQQLRVVFDELLIGNHLEEIRCRQRTLTNMQTCDVGNGGYQQVPEGTTPDDIANCAVADDVLETTCSGAHAVCLNDQGVPCGVFDEDENGSADDTRMIAGQVALQCGSFRLDLNQDMSFWQPAGNQLVPAGQIPENSLGPALILYPVSPMTGDVGLMPTNQTCHLVFADDVTDKSHIRPCAPAGGDLDGACTPGDVSGFSFKVEPLFSTFSMPSDGATGVSKTNRSLIIIWNTKLDAASTGGITIQEGAGGTRADFTASIASGNTMTITMNADFLANTQYTVTFGGAKDTYQIAAPTPVALHFTTGN